MANKTLEQSNIASRTKRRSGGTGTGKGTIRGVINANGGWLFVVQAFGTSSKDVPILCQFRTADQLKGNIRKKAESWLNYLA